MRNLKCLARTLRTPITPGETGRPLITAGRWGCQWSQVPCLRSSSAIGVSDMSITRQGAFGDTVRKDFDRRRGRIGLEERGLPTPDRSPFETRSLGHPDFDYLTIGQRATAPMVAVFLDLTDFTGRTFWDDQEETVDLAHAVLTGFIETVTAFGGHAIGLRGDGLFAGFSPGPPELAAVMALSACSLALWGVQQEVNPWLEQNGIRKVQARAGVDYGDITFIRSGSRERSEVNPLGFAANFAAKCEKTANSWEVVVGEGVANLLPVTNMSEHAKSPKTYTRDYERKTYRFYDYNWLSAVPHLAEVAELLDGTTTSDIVEV